jgi:copper homeostasis protein
MSPKLNLEVIATSPDDAAAAQAGGADRIELVVALDRGGLSPPISLVEAVLSRVEIPVRVMVRGTVAHEVADDAVLERLVGFAHELGSCPIDGLVVGVISNGHVDRPKLSIILDAAGGKPATFHRAFEALSDPMQGIEDLRRVQAVDGILTSGGSGSWTQRASLLAALARAGAPRIAIVVGGGVTLETLDDVARVPGIRYVHAGRAAREPAADDAPVSARRVEAIVARLDALARENVE